MRHTTEGYFATVAKDGSSDFFRDITYAENLQSAYQNLTQTYTPDLKAIIKVIPVNVVAQDGSNAPSKKNAKKITQMAEEGLEPHLDNTWRLPDNGKKLSVLVHDIAWIGLDQFPFFEHSGLVYRRISEETHMLNGWKLDDLFEAAAQSSVQNLIAGARNWDDVNAIVERLKSQAKDRFGTDFSSPEFDI